MTADVTFEPISICYNRPPHKYVYVMYPHVLLVNHRSEIIYLSYRPVRNSIRLGFNWVRRFFIDNSERFGKSRIRRTEELSAVIYSRTSRSVNYLVKTPYSIAFSYLFLGNPISLQLRRLSQIIRRPKHLYISQAACLKHYFYL